MVDCKAAPTPIVRKQDTEEDKEPLVDPDEKTIYKSVVGIGQHLQRKRPDAQFALRVLSRDLANPTVGAMKRARRFARYLQGTRDIALFYPEDGDPRVVAGRSDTDWAGCEVTRKSVACAMAFSGDCLLRSFVRTQQVRSKSSGEAEFYGLVDTTQEIILLQSVLKFVGMPMAAEVGTDSSAAKSMSERMGVGPRVRHLETSSLWIQDCVKDKHIKVVKVPGEHNPSDLGTKPLDHPRMKQLMHDIGCRSVSELHSTLVKPEVLTKQPRGWKRDRDSHELGAISSSSSDDMSISDIAVIVAEAVVAVLQHRKH